MILLGTVDSPLEFLNQIAIRGRIWCGVHVGDARPYGSITEPFEASVSGIGDGLILIVLLLLMLAVLDPTGRYLMR